MEQAIFVPDYPSCFRRDRPGLNYIFENAIKFDEEDVFLEAIKHPDFIKLRDDLIEPLWIFQEDAVRIGSAVFEGKSKGFYEVKDMLSNGGEGMTPIQIAAACNAPKLINYLIQRGDSVDVPCNVPIFNFKRGEYPHPIDLALEGSDRQWLLPSPAETKFWDRGMSILELLVIVCRRRGGMEAIRLLVQKTKNKERVRQSFIDYADKGKLVHVAILFLAVPELFLPYTFLSLRDGLSSSLEMSLLLDVLAAVGDKLVAYVRVHDPNVIEEFSVQSNQCLITFLLREVAYQKLGGASYRYDYFLRLFMPVGNLSPRMRKWRKKASLYQAPSMFFHMRRYPYPDIDYINENLSLTPDAAAVLYTAIVNKLSSMSRFHDLFLVMGIAHRLAFSYIEDPLSMEKDEFLPYIDDPLSMQEEKYLPYIDRLSMQKEKYLPKWFSTVCGKKFEPVFNSFHKKAAIRTRPKYKFDFKLSPTRQYLEKRDVMQPQRTNMMLSSFLSLLKGSNLNLPMAFKRFMRR